MGWGSRPHRVAARGFGGRRFRNRVVIARNEVSVVGAMSDGPVIVLPSVPVNLQYAKDLYQRVYCTTVGNYQVSKTVQIDGALYSASAYGGGEPPDENSTWTLIAGTTLGQADSIPTRHVQQTPTLFDGLTFASLWTWVYQSPGAYDEPFTVVHELWGNFVRWVREQKPMDPVVGHNTSQWGTREHQLRILSKASG